MFLWVVRLWVILGRVRVSRVMREWSFRGSRKGFLRRGWGVGCVYSRFRILCRSRSC